MAFKRPVGQKSSKRLREQKKAVVKRAAQSGALDVDAEAYVQQQARPHTLVHAV